MGLLRFGIKSSIAGGIVYYTIQEGLWSSPEDSAKLYNKLYNNISPLIQKNVPKDVMEEQADRDKLHVYEILQQNFIKNQHESYMIHVALQECYFLTGLQIHQIPTPSDLKVLGATYWNKGVITSIKFLSELPTHLSNGIDKIQKEIEKSSLTESAKPAETKQS